MHLDPHEATPAASPGAKEPSLTMPLAEAIRRHVTPGAHLHFASTPSRSNAALRELARAFAGKDPGFTLSTTGFHSLAHLAGLLRLGRRFIACFLGDNYPTPRPNPLYQRLLDEGVDLEHWSLLTYVTALRAGALGDAFGVTRSLAGTTLGDELTARGKYVELRAGPGPERRAGAVAAMRPDVTFVHAVAADETGEALLSAPYGEGTWSALAASRGVIVTAERVVRAGALRAPEEAVRIPRHRVLAVCEEPHGAHPQSLHVTPALRAAGYGPGYRDDVEHFLLWRRAAAAGELPPGFADLVLDGEDGAAGYARFAGRDRLASLSADALPLPRPEPAERGSASPAERTVALAARRIARRARAQGHTTLLAGVGQSFFAARLARRWLDVDGTAIEVNVEVGLVGVEAGPAADGFFMSHENMRLCRRLSSIDEVLGSLTCGAGNRCLGVIGAAQVDRAGRINSTRLAGGRQLVGSGGANDIATCAAEVMVLAPLSDRRLVAEVDHVTSPGERVVEIVTDRCVLRRGAAGEAAWWIEDVLPLSATLDEALQQIRASCPWPLHAREDLAFAEPLSAEERRLLAEMDPSGHHLS